MGGTLLQSVSCFLFPSAGLPPVLAGKDTHVVRSEEEVDRLTRGEGLAPKWVLQELVPGRLDAGRETKKQRLLIQRFLSLTFVHVL